MYIVYPKIAFLFRYFVSGTTGALFHVLLLFLLHRYGHLSYLIASSVAYVLSIFLGFILQKFWTFGDKRKTVLPTQFFSYALVIGISILGNGFLLYLLVEKLNMWYLAAQVIASLIIAIQNLFLYSFFVFKKPPDKNLLNSSGDVVDRNQDGDEENADSNTQRNNHKRLDETDERVN